MCVAVSKTLSELELRWKTDKPVVLYESLKMPQFEFGGVETSMCEQEQSSSIGKIGLYRENRELLCAIWASINKLII